MPPTKDPMGWGMLLSRCIQQNRETDGSPEEGRRMGWAFNAHRLPLHAMGLPPFPTHEFL